MALLRFLGNRYFLAYLVLYTSGALYLLLFQNFEPDELIATLVVIGIGFCSVAYLLSYSSKPIFQDRALVRNEGWWLLALIIFMVIYLTYNTRLMNAMIPDFILQDEINNSFLILFKKLTAFVLIPFLVYRFVLKFPLRDLGFQYSWKEVVNRKSIFIFLGMSVLMLAFQYFAGNGAKPIRDGEFTLSQVVTGSIFSFMWLILEVGLVEEFFFRVILQSRFTAWLHSATGGIVVSVVIFALAHAPGMYLRGAGVIEGLGATPTLLTVLAYCICTLSLAGFFMGIIWARTKNLWLVMMVHAMVDLLPNLPEFIRRWDL